MVLLPVYLVGVRERLRCCRFKRSSAGLWFVLALLLSAEPAQAQSAYPWDERVESASDYVDHRSGRIAFAVIDETGRMRGRNLHEVHQAASVVKAMMLVAYLRRGSVRDRDLRASDKKLLRAMIIRSGNKEATAVRNIVGNPALTRLARRVRMKDFVATPNWGATRTSAYDQALLFRRIDSYVPARHRAYAMSLLGGIVTRHRWGLGQVIPEGWELYFKGGWNSGLENQVGLFKHGSTRVSVAVLTDGDPSPEYGRETIRGTAERLLEGITTALP